MPAPQKTDPTPLLGRWELTGFSEQYAGHRSGSYAIIFRDRSLYIPESFSSAGGETLEITNSDGEIHFSMRGGAKVPWTSAEKEQGVLIDSIEDQDGRIVSSVAPYLRMERLVDGTWVSKYSDSDLDMDNVMFTDGPDLVLMMTTIVDELYVAKYFYRFSRASPAFTQGQIPPLDR